MLLKSKSGNGEIRLRINQMRIQILYCGPILQNKVNDG